MSYSLFQTSQTGGQWYSDTSPFRIPWRCHTAYSKPVKQEVNGTVISPFSIPWRCHSAYSKPVKREVNGTVIPLPLVFPGDVIQLIPKQSNGWSMVQ